MIAISPLKYTYYLVVAESHIEDTELNWLGQGTRARGMLTKQNLVLYQSGYVQDLALLWHKKMSCECLAGRWK
jgi:hypothetical protein